VASAAPDVRRESWRNHGPDSARGELVLPVTGRRLGAAGRV